MHAQMLGDPVRLSSWVFFVDHGDHVMVHHTITGCEWRADRALYRRLLEFSHFRANEPDLHVWTERGVLVPLFRDPLVPRCGSPGEASLGAAWNDWYWKHEVESEREYRWHGEVVLKMPSDLFMYQELVCEDEVRRVLEVGAGRGGGLWFFAGVLALHGGGHVVGVELDPYDRLPPFERYPAVRVDLVHGDAHEPETVARVAALAPSFDLIVVDADPDPLGKVALLERWAPLVAAGGTIVVEDLSAPECVAREQEMIERLDGFLLAHREFGITAQVRRFATGKAMRGVFRRMKVRDG